MELQRAKVLQHDLIKSYVRLPDLQQKRMVEFAHSIGVPVATHEIYPAALVGVDNTEHTSATSRRGYSPKMATLCSAYDDVDRSCSAKSSAIFCPMISGAGVREPVREGAGVQERSALQALSRLDSGAGIAAADEPRIPGGDPRRSGKMVLDAMHAGALVVAGTDEPIAAWPARRADDVRAWLG